MQKPSGQDNHTNSEKTLRYLLFRESLGAGAGYLFAGQRELAEAISAASGGKIQSESAYTKLSPILNGKRGASADFESLMLEAARTKLEGLDNRIQAEWISKIKEALSAIQRQVATESRKEVGFTERLGQASKNARLRLVIPPGYTNPRTGAVTLTELSDAETRTGTAAILLTTLQLIGQNRGQPTDARYIFLYRSKREVMLLWETLFNILVGRAKVDPPIEAPYMLNEAADILERLDREAVLQFYVVSPSYCMVPIVLYDPDQEERFSAWLVYFKNGKLDPYDIPSENVAIWRNFFQDFISQVFRSSYVGGDAAFDGTDKPQLYVRGWLHEFSSLAESLQFDEEGRERKLEYDMKPPQRILFEAGRAGFIQYAEMYGTPTLARTL